MPIYDPEKILTLEELSDDPVKIPDIDFSTWYGASPEKVPPTAPRATPLPQKYQNLADITGGQYDTEQQGVMYYPKDAAALDTTLQNVSAANIPFDAKQTNGGYLFSMVDQPKATRDQGLATLPESSVDPMQPVDTRGLERIEEIRGLDRTFNYYTPEQMKSPFMGTPAKTVAYQRTPEGYDKMVYASDSPAFDPDRQYRAKRAKELELRRMQEAGLTERAELLAEQQRLAEERKRKAELFNRFKGLQELTQAAQAGGTAPEGYSYIPGWREYVSQFGDETIPPTDYEITTSIQRKIKNAQTSGTPLNTINFSPEELNQIQRNQNLQNLLKPKETIAPGVVPQKPGVPQKEISPIRAKMPSLQEFGEVVFPSNEQILRDLREGFGGVRKQMQSYF